MNAQLIRGLCYIVASGFFIFGLKMLSSPRTARKGNIVSAIGMLIAIVTTLTALTDIKWVWLLAGAGTPVQAGQTVALIENPDVL